MTGNVVNFHKPNGENIQKREEKACGIYQF